MDGPAHSAGARDPGLLAQQWLDHLRDEHGAGAGEPVLWHHHRRWYAWDGRRWRRTDGEQLALRLARYLRRAGAGDFGRRLLERVMLHVQAETLLDSGDTAPPFEVRRAERMQLRPRRFIRFDNGVLRLRADGRPSTFIGDAGSRYFATASVPCAYDPEADWPRWRAFLDTVLPPEPAGDLGEPDQRQAVLQEAVAASLLGEPRHRPLVLLRGTAGGGNGRSTFVRVWQALLDGDSVSRLDFAALGSGTALAALEGRRLNIAEGMPQPAPAERQRLMQVLRGEPVDLYGRGATPRRIVPTAICVGIGEQLPHLTVEDRRWWRMATVVPFDLTISPEQEDPGLARRIIDAERAGVVNWALAAAARLGRGRPTRCPRCQREAAAHAGASDPLEQFLGECCVLPSRSDPAVREPRDALYQAYRQYCRSRLGGERPLSRARFGQRLRQYGVGDARDETLPDGRRPRFYTHIALSADGIALLREIGYPGADEVAGAG